MHLTRRLSSSFGVDTFVYLSNITAKVVDLRINQLAIGVSVASCHFLGDQFFPVYLIPPLRVASTFSVSPHMINFLIIRVFRSNFSIHSFSLFICCFCAATGYTEYYFNTESGRVCRQWNYSATAKSIGFWFFMNRWLWVDSYAGMWSIGMFQKWHFLSKYSDQAAGYGRLAERLQCKDLKFEEPWEISVGTALTAKLFHGMFFLMSLVYKRQIEAH